MQVVDEPWTAGSGVQLIVPAPAGLTSFVIGYVFGVHADDPAGALVPSAQGVQLAEPWLALNVLIAQRLACVAPVVDT